MDLTEQLKALQLSPRKAPLTSQQDSAFCFLHFFKKGTAGKAVFAAHVVPFLSLDDLLRSAATCRQMNTMCRAYTVGDILEKYSVDISRNHKMELGKLIMGFVSPRYNEGQVHRRFVRTSNESFWARLYHPSQLPEIELAMAAYFTQHGIEFDAGFDGFDWDENADAATPVLVSATFGRDKMRKIDVTVIIRFLLMKQGNTELVLERPVHGNRYWYICLFGDPIPNETKTLWITTRLENGHHKTRSFCEDTPITMKLRADRG